MDRSKSRAVALLCLSWFLVSPVSMAEGFSRYMQGMVGWLEAEDVWQIDDETTGEPLAADMGDLLYGGAAVQMNFSESAFEYGYESGGLVSFKNDASYLAASGSHGGTVIAELDNEFWLVDLYMGAYAGLSVGEHLRLYVSAGPALMIGSLSIEGSEPVPAPNSGTVVISSAGRETDASVGLYGKLGIDLIFSNGITVGASVRQVNGKLDFNDAGEMSFNHPQYFITVGKKY